MRKDDLPYGKPFGQVGRYAENKGRQRLPDAIEEVVLSVEELGPHYEIVVTREGYSDKLEIRVELAKACDEFAELKRIEAKVKKGLHTILGLDAKVTLVSPNTLRRFEGKAKRIVDLRNNK